jgi:hypothetical protein
MLSAFAVHSKHSDDNTFLSPEYFLKMRKYGFEDLDLVFNRLFKQAVVRRKLLKAWPSKGKHPINFPTVP